MIIYSKKIIRFIHEIKCIIKDVLSKEIHLKVTGNRFYNRQQSVSYPIHIVVYNNKSMLGYFDSSFYELGFHERLMHSSQQQLFQVIRHELAHYITFINYGEAIQPHGPEFKAFCKQMGWGEEVYQATSYLEDESTTSNAKDDIIFRKVQKLMALAGSSNKNEAEQAMIKSQQLLLKHNIESTYIPEDDDNEKIFLKRILKQKKENAKIRSIATILTTFFVGIIYNRGCGFTYLEIIGNAVNIEIADHVAHVLDRELDKLWDQTQQLVGLKGIIAKNSFFLGLAKGYCDKVQALRRDDHPTTTSALMIIEKKLIDAQTMVYPRLSSIKRHINYCPRSSFLGEQMGKQLNIHPAINKTSSLSKKLTYSG